MPESPNVAAVVLFSTTMTNSFTGQEHNYLKKALKMNFYDSMLYGPKENEVPIKKISSIASFFADVKPHLFDGVIAFVSWYHFSIF